MEKRENKSKNQPRGLMPGVDNDKIVSQLVEITSKAENHAKVRRTKDGRLCISAVIERMVS